MFFFYFGTTFGYRSIVYGWLGTLGYNECTPSSFQIVLRYARFVTFLLYTKSNLKAGSGINKVSGFEWIHFYQKSTWIMLMNSVKWWIDWCAFHIQSVWVYLSIITLKRSLNLLEVNVILVTHYFLKCSIMEIYHFFNVDLCTMEKRQLIINTCLLNK